MRCQLSAILAMLSLGANGYAVAEPGYAPKVGSRHADFVLPDSTGKPVRLSDFRGKKVLLVHFAGW